MQASGYDLRTEVYRVVPRGVVTGITGACADGWRPPARMQAGGMFHLGRIGNALARTLAAFLNPDSTGKNSFAVF
jgi:hypothetical protein